MVERGPCLAPGPLLVEFGNDETLQKLPQELAVCAQAFGVDSDEVTR